SDRESTGPTDPHGADMHASPRIPLPRRPRALVLAWIAMLAFAGRAAPGLRAQEEKDAAAGVEIDRERLEVRVPSSFVNPSRQIEVFACHRTGPTHETVLKFDVDGNTLYRALLAIGCRPTDIWNATSPSDFLRNQGDRILLLVRWEENGKVREAPAEFLLEEGDTGWLAFLRGFSFSAFDVEAYAQALREAAEAEREAAQEGADGEAENGAAQGALPRAPQATPRAQARDDDEDDPDALPLSPDVPQGPLARGEVPE